MGVSPALVDLPHEGHGVLIAPQWIVTAAHATQWHPVEEVMLDGVCRKVERVVVHPGYRALPKALQSGDIARPWTARTGGTVRTTRKKKPAPGRRFR